MTSVAATTGSRILDEDAFDGSSEPIIYMSENRMPVIIEFNNIFIYIFFSALILALLFILPGIRKTKLTSFIGLITFLSVGATILLSLEGSNWLSGVLQIQNSQYSSLTTETLTGRLEINIGLKSANVTLIGKLMGNTNDNNNNNNGRIFSYNERFYWNEPDKMLEEHYKALKKGLPYPILTITEFLSQDSDGFNWTRHLRQAGYYSTLVLYLSLISWLLMGLIMCALPIYLPHLMQITGALLIFSVWLYTLLIQSPKIYSIQVNGNPLEVSFGSTYVYTFISGALSMFAGLIMMAIQINSNPSEQFTIMDSEQYVQDNKALYNQKLASIQDTKTKSFILYSNNYKKQTQSNSVIIPINDIEEKFNMGNRN